MQFSIGVSRHRDVKGSLIYGARVSRDIPPTRQCREISEYLWAPDLVRRTRKPACVRGNLVRWHTKAGKRHNLRDVEAIAESVSFSDAANFRQAFRRWTKAAPHVQGHFPAKL
jgi:AraC-like DNA-binding protein